MCSRDFRGDPITGANPNALEAFESALADFRSWRGDPTRGVAKAVESAPDFVMPYVLWGYALLCTRDPASVRAAAPICAKAAALPANSRERLHVAAISAILRDDYGSGRAILVELLTRHPRDLLALQALQAFDYLTGEVDRFMAVSSAVATAWSSDLPGYHALLAMRAFGFAESGEHERAEALGLEALALEPLDARAHHALAHVFEMAGRPDDGVQWMLKHISAWDGDTFVATHCRWHLALFHLERDEIDQALALYDDHIGSRSPRTVADLIDASSLLWRVALMNGSIGDRWVDLAADWWSHITDGFCTFTDLHAMMAFVGAQNWELAARLMQVLEEWQFLPTRYGVTTRLVGVPACRGLLAFGTREFATAARLLDRLPPLAHRLGGSHAQRDVIDLTLNAAAALAGDRTRLPRLAA